MTVDVKICGINDAAAMQAAVENGARYVGLVFYPPSPRAVASEAAKKLAALVPARVTVVGLFVDPPDGELLAAAKNVPLGMIQLHGSETPERVKQVRALTGLPVMKAIGIAAAEDFGQVAAYEAVADMLLFDAKPGAGKPPGGNAAGFDWSLLRGRSFKKPWLLAGGLTPENVVKAVKTSGAGGVDVSSGVEDRPGHKNLDMIHAFLLCAAQS